MVMEELLEKIAEDLFFSAQNDKQIFMRGRGGKLRWLNFGFINSNKVLISIEENRGGKKYLSRVYTKKQAIKQICNFYWDISYEQICRILARVNLEKNHRLSPETVVFKSDLFQLKNLIVNILLLRLTQPRLFNKKIVRFFSDYCSFTVPDSENFFIIEEEPVGSNCLNILYTFKRKTDENFPKTVGFHIPHTRIHPIVKKELKTWGIEVCKKSKFKGCVRKISFLQKNNVVSFNRLVKDI